MLTYHHAACRELGIAPDIDEAILPRIASFEDRHGVRLPAAVRELYALPAVGKLLAEDGNRTWPGDRLDDAVTFPEWYEDTVGDDFDQEDPHLLIVRWDGESCLLWAVSTEDGDDPPVLIGFDEEPDDPQWSTFTDSYSDFVFVRAWDQRTMPFLVGEIDSPDLGAALVADGFRRLPVFRSPFPDIPPEQRFDAPGQRVSIDTGGAGSCVLAADTETDLGELIRKVSRHGTLTPVSIVPGMTELFDRLRGAGA